MNESEVRDDGNMVGVNYWIDGRIAMEGWVAAPKQSSLRNRFFETNLKVKCLQITQHLLVLIVHLVNHVHDSFVDAISIATELSQTHDVRTHADKTRCLPRCPKL